MTGNTVASPDSNTMLIQLCVKALASVAPEGMTTKELAAALDREVKGTSGFDGISSSILSSKLNAIFRRCHGDAAAPSRAQLAELPLTRSQSSEVPRRLVYKYTPADSSEVPEAPSTPVEDTSSGDESPDLNEPLTPKEDSLTDRSTFGPAAAKKRRVSANAAKEGQYITEPGTPPDTFSATADVPQQRRNEQECAPPKRRAVSDSTDSDSRKPQQGQPEPHNRQQAVLSKDRGTRFRTDTAVGLNLYYDALGLDAMSAALNCKQLKAPESKGKLQSSRESGANASSDLDWSEFPSPELLGLHELDGFVC